MKENQKLDESLPSYQFHLNGYDVRTRKTEINMGEVYKNLLRRVSFVTDRKSIGQNPVNAFT